MKELSKILLTILCVSLYHNAKADNPDITWSVFGMNNSNFLFFNVENELTISSKKYPDTDLFVSISQGGILKTDSSSYKAIIHSVAEPVTIRVFAIQRGVISLLDEKYFSVQKFPEPRLSFCGVLADASKTQMYSVNNGQLLSFDSLYSYLAPEFIFSNVPVEVESFRVTINSGKKSKVIEVKTSAFNTELSTAFQNISDGDMILLDVNVKYAGIRSNIQPFKFTVHIIK
jgi:hypothetical protein